MTLPKFEVRLAFRQLLPYFKVTLKPIKLLHLGAAGPNHSVSMLGI